VPAAFAAPQAQEPDADALLERALAQHRAGDVLGAIDAYLALLERDAGRADVRSNLGVAYARLGRHEEAIAQYRLALAGGSVDPAIRFNLGLALFKAARFPEAAEELARVVERQPENKGALLLLAECSLQLGNSAKVVELLAPHEAAYGEDRAYAFLLGSALVQENDLKRGQIFIDRVLRGGDSAEVHLLMGAAHLRARDLQAARNELRRAAEMNPSLPTVNSLLGKVLQLMGDGQGAEEAYRRELEINPNDFDANLSIGSLRRDEGRFDEALAYLTRAARLRADDLTVLHALASLYVSSGAYQKACDTLEPLVKRVPDFQQGHVLLAMAYARLGRMQDAERERAIARRLGAERQRSEEGARPASSTPPAEEGSAANRPPGGKGER
jgi:tetratricopeptide (TPR) repeat protein